MPNAALKPGKNGRDGQRGAALMIVLLLVATLAFIALSITEKTAVASARSYNERARSENLWRAFGAEILAGAALETAREAVPDKMSIDDPWAIEPLVVPMEDGSAQIYFADATTCFNVNSLAESQATGTGPTPKDEFVLLVRNLGLGDFEGQRIADVITDWIDEDTSREAQGAEDNYYTALPSPYRSGGQRMATTSELRALNGITSEIYTTLKPYLCAQDSPSPSPLNVNMLTARHAPLLAAVLGANITPSQAADLIAARPPGGYQTVAEFLTPDLTAGLGLAALDASRLKVVSQYIKAHAEIVYDTAVMEVTSIFEVQPEGTVIVLRRRIGAEE